MMPESTVLPNRQPDVRCIPSSEAEIGHLCEQVTRYAHPLNDAFERRSQRRVPYSQLIRFLPISNHGLMAVEPLYVIGKHLAPQGLDFYHHEPIPHRTVVASFEAGSERWVHFLMRINWCRFLRTGWYDSGGKFTKVVEFLKDGTQPIAIPSPPASTPGPVLS